MAEVKPWLFKSAEVSANVWYYRAESGTPIEALLDQYYWVHICGRLTDGDEIKVLAEDSSYWLHLLVLEHDAKFAKVFVLQRHEFTATQLLNVSIPPGYTVELRGPRKWSVLHGNEVLKDGMTKSQAEQWLTDHIKAPKAA